MGNCMTVHRNSNKIASLSPQDDENLELTHKYLMKIKRRKATTPTSRLPAVATEKIMPVKQKSVRFVKRDDHKNVDVRGEDGKKRSTAPAVRLRVLVTKNELREILKQQREELRSSSLEELVRAAKLREYRGRFSSEGRRMDYGNCDETAANGVWRPALETILEDH